MPMTKKQTIKEKTDAEHKKIKQKSKKTTPDEKLHQIQQQLKQKEEQLLRSYADYQNYQKRIQKDKENHEFELKKHYISELIDLKELLLKALDDKDPKEGLRILLKNLEQFFESEHITYIESIGKPFNHEYHHAVTIIEKPDSEDNTIIEEIKKGYKIEKKVLRPSHVIVAKKQCEEE